MLVLVPAGIQLHQGDLESAATSYADLAASDPSALADPELLTRLAHVTALVRPGDAAAREAALPGAQAPAPDEVDRLERASAGGVAQMSHNSQQSFVQIWRPFLFCTCLALIPP